MEYDRVDSLLNDYHEVLHSGETLDQACGVERCRAWLEDDRLQTKEQRAYYTICLKSMYGRAARESTRIEWPPSDEPKVPLPDRCTAYLESKVLDSLSDFKAAPPIRANTYLPDPNGDVVNNRKFNYQVDSLPTRVFRYLAAWLDIEREQKEYPSCSPLLARVRTGAPLDPVEIYLGAEDEGYRKVDMHEGRHRAYCAEKLGVPRIPILWRFEEDPPEFGEPDHEIELERIIPEIGPYDKPTMGGMENWFPKKRRKEVREAAVRSWREARYPTR